MKILLLTRSIDRSEPSQEVGPTATRFVNRVPDPATRSTYCIQSSEV